MNQISKNANANANADVLSRLPLPATAEDFQPRYRLTDPSDLDVYFVGASEIHPSSLRTSSDSSLVDWPTTRVDRQTLEGDPRRCFFVTWERE